MSSPWIDVKNLLILHGSNIHYIAMFIIFITFMFSVCTRTAESSREPPKKVKSQQIPVDTSVTAADTTSTVKQAAAGGNQKSSKGKSEMLDSIKIMKGKKNNRKARQLPGKNNETDSQHTEIIHVPVGKASESSTGVSKLTTPTEQKHVEKSSGKRVQFAEKMIKSTISPDANGKQTMKSQNTK